MEQSGIILAYPEGGEQIRTLVRGEEILFCLSDVVQLLAQRNTQLAAQGERNSLSALVQATIKILHADETVHVPKEAGQVAQQYVTEPGLYRIILADPSPACVQFQKWVLHEVLPCIRKHGTYPAPVQNSGTEVKRAVELLLKEINERERLERETKLRFESHEKQLQDLNEKIAEIRPAAPGEGYLTVEEFCFSQEPPIEDRSQKLLINGWCAKLCLEENQQQHRVNGEFYYPRDILERALESITH